jgi:hypothetical protein
MSVTLEKAFRVRKLINDGSQRGTLVVAAPENDPNVGEYRRVWWVKDGNDTPETIKTPFVRYTLNKAEQITGIEVVPYFGGGGVWEFEVMRELPVSPGTTQMMFNQVEVKIPVGIAT